RGRTVSHHLYLGHADPRASAARRLDHAARHHRRSQRALLMRRLWSDIRALSARFAGDRQGLTLVEFAFLVPIMTAITLSSIEIGRYALLNQKLQHAATSMADLAARDGALTVAQLDSLFAAVPSIAQPFKFKTRGRAIVSSIHATVDGDPEIAWQRGGGGTLAAASQI